MNRVGYYKPKQNYDAIYRGMGPLLDLWMELVQDGWNPIAGSMNAGDQKSTGIQNICFPLELKHQTSLAWGFCRFPVYWRGWSMIRLQEFRKRASSELTEMGIFQPEPGYQGAWHFRFFFLIRDDDFYHKASRKHLEFLIARIHFPAKTKNSSSSWIFLRWTAIAFDTH